MQIKGFGYALAVLIDVLTVAACGSDGTKTVSRSDFIAKADAICRSADAEIRALHERLGERLNEAAVLSLVHGAAAIQLEALDRVRAVGRLDKDQNELVWRVLPWGLESCGGDA